MIHDTRDLFDEFCRCKSTFDECKSDTTHKNLSKPHMDALRYLINNRSCLLSDESSVCDDLFHEDTQKDCCEQIVKYKGDYYYVNTEGYTYCRYMFYIPDSIILQITSPEFDDSVHPTMKEHNELYDMVYALQNRVKKLEARVPPE